MPSQPDEAPFLWRSDPHPRRLSNDSYELDDRNPAAWTDEDPRAQRPSSPFQAAHAYTRARSVDSRDPKRGPAAHVTHVDGLPSPVRSHPAADGAGPDAPSARSQRKGGVNWRAPTLMVVYLVVGLCFAVGHHVYWFSLHDTVVPSQTDQEWSQRLGIAAAFLAQSALTLAVGVAYTQRIWVAVRRRPWTLAGLDKIFALQDDLVAFASAEVLGRAKLLCLLGLIAWCLPISSTVSSATLSVRAGVVTNYTQVAVPVPDYANSSQSTWAGLEGVGRLESATPAITRVAAGTSASMAILGFPAPFPNASYDVSFYGPAFRCQNLSTAVLDNSTTSTTTLDLGTASSLQDVFEQTMNGSLDSTGEYLYVGASPGALGGVRMYSHLFVTTNYWGTFGQYGQNYSCHLWNTSYDLTFVFSNGEQTTNIRALEHVAPLSIASSEIVIDYPEGEVQYWTMFTALLNILATSISRGSTGSLIGADSVLLQTGIAGCPEIANSTSGATTTFANLFSDWMCRAGSVPGAIEDLSHNLTISVLSSALLARDTTANVTVHSAATFYSYNWRNLVMAYAVAVAAALLCVGVGFHALFANGYSAGASFSSILLTTRNPDLDRLAQGHCLGARPVTTEVGKTVLRFGVLKSQPYDEVAGGHAAFGLRDDVRTLRKGEKCW